MQLADTILLLLAARASAMCGWSCRHGLNPGNSPPPPPPLRSWSVARVSEWVDGEGLNGTSFADQQINGAALVELWQQRLEQPDAHKATVSQLLGDQAKLGQKLSLMHKLRGMVRDSVIPAPPPPPQPSPPPFPPPSSPPSVSVESGKQAAAASIGGKGGGGGGGGGKGRGAG